MEDYLEKIRHASDILRGNTGQVKRELTERMYEHAENERYELAAKCRDTIAALDRLGQKQKVVAPSDTEYDVIGLYNDELCSSVSVFFIRDGAVSDKEEFVFGADRILDEQNGNALLLCEMLIDAQAYQTCFNKSTGYLTDAAGEYVLDDNGNKISANNYEHSTIRAWLADTFYATAFTDLQKDIIQLTTVDNSAASTTDSTGALSLQIPRRLWL